MASLPDLEALGIFAKVVEARSFARAAAELSLSKATVSKAVARLEKKLGARLLNRTSRRLALTESGRQLSTRAQRILEEGEAAENEALSDSAAPRGRVRLAVPMSFGVTSVAPLIPDFLAAYPEVSIDLHLNDAMVDLIGEGFDAALRIASLPDSSMVARRLCAIQTLLVVAPSYLKAHGEPKHPLHLEDHACLCYAYQAIAENWRFSSSTGEIATVRPSGPLRVNNGDAMLPALIAGLGFGVLPDFIVREALASGELVTALAGWSLPTGALHWITPPGGPRPARVGALGDFLAKRLSQAAMRKM